MGARRLMFFMLTAWLMVQNGSAAVPLSSRLVHWFSDEVRAFRISRNGSAASSSWPERKESVEYYQMLLSSDFRRHNMKLGAQKQLLFPSRGSNTMSFGNDFGWFAFSPHFLNALFDSIGLYWNIFLRQMSEFFKQD